MIDNDIIKALECCKKDDCDNCPNNFGNCYANLSGYALDLINRQQAQLADERAKIEICAETISRQDAEIERLRNENKILSKNADTAFQDGLNEAQDLYDEQIKDEVKAESIKEFAEKLKKRFYLCAGRCVVDVYHIDNLVKEMVGEE